MTPSGGHSGHGINGGVLVAIAAAGIGFLLWKRGLLGAFGKKAGEPGTAGAAAAQLGPSVGAYGTTTFSPDGNSIHTETPGSFARSASDFLHTISFGIFGSEDTSLGLVDWEKAATGRDMEIALGKIKELGAMSANAPITIIRVGGGRETLSASALIKEWQDYVNQILTVGPDAAGAPPEAGRITGNTHPNNQWTVTGTLPYGAPPALPPPL